MSGTTCKTTRRDMLAKLLLGGTAAASFATHEERILAEELESCSGKPLNTNWAKLADLKGKIPISKIGNVEISRMILGGNLIGGWAHARDLMYLSDLVVAYHTRDKIYETFQLAEACGINTFLTTPNVARSLMTPYREQTGGKMQLIADTGNDDKTVADDGVKKAIDAGASLIYVLGEATDRYFLRDQGKFDLIAECLERIRAEGYPAGIGAHRVEACKMCIELGIVPDFWMLTYHHLGYWSAVPGREERDNVFCRRPEETAEFMAGRPEPWIAFKTLAAGALKPQDGFRFAFEGGADFICVGMYDFQVVDDVNICTAVLNGDLNRGRSWKTANV